MAILRLAFVVTLLIVLPAHGAGGCAPLAPLVKSLHATYGSGPFDLTALIKRWLIVDPEKQLRPGDVMIYPMKDQVERGFRQPAAYKAALEGYGHAGIVASDDKGLYHLDAPLPPPEFHREFRGKDTYFVVRPKTPKGMTRETFEKKVNETTAVFRAIGFEYDALMTMDYMDPKQLKKLEALVQKGCPAKPTDGPSPIPAQYCSELTQSILVLSGAKPAKAVTADKMLELGLKKVKNDAELKKAVDDVIDMYLGPVPKIIKEIERELKEMPKDDPKRKFVEEDLKRFKAEQQRYEMGRILLLALARQKMKGGKDRLGLLQRPVVRPVDILADAMKGTGDFELVGFYPGHLEATCKPPKDDDLPPDDLPPDSPGH